MKRALYQDRFYDERGNPSELGHFRRMNLFPRDYGRLGCPEVRASRLTRSLHPEVGADYFGYVARLARVPD